jgi:UDP-GlcNAc:undecaprenyl-phosphate GlcNAc-1-phosphate transferase
MFLLGLVDDLHPLSPPTKLVVQVFAASIVIFLGKPIAFFPWGFANVILTFFWLVGMTNAMNLLDNMDGLAGGISLIAAGFLSYFYWRGGSQTLLLASLCLAGSLLGFLIYNFPPARIFMGDSGSQFLGFILAAMAVTRRPQASNVFTVLGVPTLLFLLPILDTFLVTITRLMRGQSPVQGGTDHTSHRLIAFGLSERQTVIALYVVGLVSGITGTVLEALDYDLSLVLIPILLISLSLLTAYLGRLKVVTAYTRQSGNLSRFMVDLTYRRRIFEMVLDFFIIGVSDYLAFWTRSGFQMDSSTMNLFLRTSPLAIAAAYLAFYLAGVYRGLWQYVGVDDLVRYVWATIGAVVFLAIPLLALYPGGVYALEIFFLYGVFLFIGLAASRSSFRVMDRVYGRQQMAGDQVNVLIYGAEDAGEIALRWIQRNPELGYRPVGFLDEDPYKWGRRIHGIDVLGGSKQVEAILDARGVGGLIIASGSGASDGPVIGLVDTCRKKGVWVRTLRLEFELFD